MSDIFGRIVSIVLLILALVAVPFILFLQKTEAIKQSMMETAAIEFIDNCRGTGSISPEAYESMYKEISKYVEFAEIKLTHSSKMVGYTDGDTIDYYVDYNNDEILNVMYETDATKNIDYKLRNGDELTITVRNTRPTIATRLTPGGKSRTTMFYTYTGTVGNYSEND